MFLTGFVWISRRGQCGRRRAMLRAVNHKKRTGPRESLRQYLGVFHYSGARITLATRQ